MPFLAEARSFRTSRGIEALVLSEPHRFLMRRVEGRQLQPWKNGLISRCSWRFDSHEHKCQKKFNVEVHDAVLARMDF
jgi:hypothetical protein